MKVITDTLTALLMLWLIAFTAAVVVALWWASAWMTMDAIRDGAPIYAYLFIAIAWGIALWAAAAWAGFFSARIGVTRSQGGRHD